MIYICAQPATQYFGWQIDVFIDSLLKNNVDQNNIHIICSIAENDYDSYFTHLKLKYSEVLFEFYTDSRTYNGYVPSIKQHLLAKHYTKYKYLQKEAVLLMDCDTALTKPIDFSRLLNDDVWYLSDTNSYLNYDYIRSKGYDVLFKMLEVSDISKHLVESNNNNSGGAQYLMKNATPEYFNDVVEMSHNLFLEITKLNEIKLSHDPNHLPLQIWTAEMWAMLWVAWKRGIMTLNHPLLNFCWSVDNISRWDEVSIYHNAGVTNEMKDLFFKASYINNLPDKNLVVNNEKCSFNYYNLVKSVVL